MKNNIIAFPGRDQREGTRGIIHVWMHGHDAFEIGHESASGSSWGFFEHFSTAADAVAAAYALNQREMNGVAEVFIPDAVLALLPGSAA